LRFAISNPFKFLATRTAHKDQGALRSALDAWFHKAQNAEWHSSAELKELYATASIVSADRVVFNIKGNSYRLVVAIDRSAPDHRAAMAEVKRLWGSKNGTPDGDRLDVLATLIDAYGAQHEPIDRPDPIEAIRFRMEHQGLTRKDLEPLIGTRTRVSEMLNRKRTL
jgi:HTH-type transcriptional regulator/antitoxin HigA